MIRYGKCDCGGDILLNLESGMCMCESCKDNWKIGMASRREFVKDALDLHKTKGDGEIRFELAREEYEECVKFMKDVEEYSKAMEEAARRYGSLGNSAVKSDSIQLRSVAEALGMEPENVRMFREICSGMPDLYARKNHDYGDSFHKSWLEEGAAAARFRIGDKFNRYKALSKGEAQLVEGETIEDTLIDMACYSIMALMEHMREAER